MTMETEQTSLTVDTIREWTGARSFELGKRAYQTGALSSPRRDDGVLRARCQGSMALPYRVEVTLAESGIGSATCNCGRGAEGRCKHTAALLFAWLESPTLFAETEPLDTTLERLSPQSLLTLLRRVARRSESVADLVEQELPFVAGAVASAEQVNVEALRREVAIALGAHRRPHYDDWAEAGAPQSAESAASSERLRPIFELGEDYLARSRYALATTVYRVITETTIEAARGDVGATFPDTVRGALRAGAEGLSRCLGGASAAGLRRSVLHALVDIVASDASSLNADAADLAEATLLTHTSAEERAELATLIRQRTQEATAQAPKSASRLEALVARLEAPATGALSGSKA